MYVLGWQLNFFFLFNSFHSQFVQFGDLVKWQLNDCGFCLLFSQRILVWASTFNLVKRLYRSII